MSTDHHIETESLVEGLEQAAQVYWPALLVEGIALMLIGVLALFTPPLITLGIAARTSPVQA
ncbi:hypothetical protein [Bradyrhizobium sp.]|uniref:hypothetical protein n=1 Tax=Bradyrhizobium sp. TaxID=376 RepID=UPI003C72DBF7